MRVRKKIAEVEAHLWQENGDHPEDNYHEGKEGEVVRYYRTPDDDSTDICHHCGGYMHDHGWIDAPEGGYVVCPDDYIITVVGREYYPCKPDIFWATHEEVTNES